MRSRGPGWRGRLAGLTVAACAFVGMAVFLGCADDPSKPRLTQPSSVGTIEGHLRSVTPAGEKWLYVTGVTGTSFEIRSRTDSTGAFQVAVPYGRYVVQWSGLGYYGSGGRLEQSSGSDTLDVRIGQEKVTIEVFLGSLELRVRTPGLPDGDPVRGEIYRDNPIHYSVSASARTHSGEAVFRFGGLPSGDYYVEAGPLDSNAMLMPVGSDVSTARRYTVGSSGQTVVEVDLPVPAVFSGTLDGSYRQLAQFLGGYTLAIQAYDEDSTYQASADFGEGSGWTLDLYEPRPVRLCVTIGSIPRWIGGRTHEEATIFNPVAGETLAVPPEVESGLLVRLEDEAGNINLLPVITVYDSLANVVGQCKIDCSSCERGNRFGVSNLLPGTYYVRVSPYSLGQSSNWASCWYEGSRDFAHATPVVIREQGEIVALEMRLPEGSVIRGQLHSEQPGYYGYGYGPEIFAASDTLTSLGKVPPQETLDPWQFSGVAPGEYLLAIRVRRTARYMYWWYPGTWIASEARAVVVDDWGQEISVEWNLPR